MYSQIESMIFSFYEEKVKLLAAVFERVAKALKTFEEDFNSVAKHFGELTKGFFDVFTTYVETVKKEITELWELLQQQLQALPGFDMIKEKYEELIGTHNINEQFTMVLKELLSTLTQSFRMTQQCEEFMKKLNEYVDLVSTNLLEFKKKILTLNLFRKSPRRKSTTSTPSLSSSNRSARLFYLCHNCWKDTLALTSRILCHSAWNRWNVCLISPAFASRLLIIWGMSLWCHCVMLSTFIDLTPSIQLNLCHHSPCTLVFLMANTSSRLTADIWHSRELARTFWLRTLSTVTLVFWRTCR